MLFAYTEMKGPYETWNIFFIQIQIFISMNWKHTRNSQREVANKLTNTKWSFCNKRYELTSVTAGPPLGRMHDFGDQLCGQNNLFSGPEQSENWILRKLHAVSKDVPQRV